MIWLIGSKGMLGTEITRQLSENKIDFVATDIDVAERIVVVVDALNDTLNLNSWLLMFRPEPFEIEFGGE